MQRSVYYYLWTDEKTKVARRLQAAGLGTKGGQNQWNTHIFMKKHFPQHLRDLRLPFEFISESSSG